MMQAALELQDVTFTIRDGQQDRRLLDGVGFAIAPGELAVLTGRSGSGKTTLLTLAGLLRGAPQGEILIAGEPTAALSDAQRTRLRREHIAIIYQSASLIPSLTALEQLELVGLLRGRSRRSFRAEAVGLLDELGISGGAQRRLPRELSGGERQRVGIARALIARPTVLIADEPTSALDAERGREIAALLAERTRHDGIATLLVTHDDIPVKIADRRLHLEAGRVLEEATMPA